jgi:4-diphosphocytidyl-2-C-methyl-D-erythritol kinase
LDGRPALRGALCLEGGAGLCRREGSGAHQRQALVRHRGEWSGALSRLHETAYAKINLALHVRRRGADGYHDLETLFAFAEHGDELSMEPAAELSLELSGPFAGGLSSGDNLVTRAASRFFEAFGAGAGAAFHLVKNLPVASGIGGGSADAGAALRLLAGRHGVAIDDPRLSAIAAGLGADVPACLVSTTLWGDGRGDRLTQASVAGLAGTPLLLVNPRVPLATGDVFRAWDGIDRGPLAEGDPLDGRNDLEIPAKRLVPAIGAVLDLLAAQPGVTIARMSGSGATCFALFESGDARDAAEGAIAARESGWWRLVSRLR